MSATANTIWSEATTVDVAFARAVACHRTGQLAEAQDLYTAILRVRPAHADAHHNLGVLLAKSEHLPTSLPHLLAAIEADPTVAQYWLSYIDALLLAERGDEARAVLQLAREHGLHSAPADALAARVKSTRTKRTRSSKSNPAQHEIDALIALFNERRYAEGELLARDMIAHFPGCGVGYKVLGSALSAQGRSAEALESLQVAARLLPKDPEIHSNLGVVLGAMGHWAEAEKCQRQALRVQSKFLNAHFNLGWALQAQSKWSDAEASYRRALGIKPDWAQCHENLARVLQAQGKHMTAMESYRRAIALDANRAAAHNDLGFLLLSAGDSVEALHCFDAALRIDSSYAAAHNNRGVTLKKIGRLEEVEACYRRAVECDPESKEAHFNLGGFLNAKGDATEAEQCYRRALKLDPNYLGAQNNLGNLLNADHRYRDALQCFRAVLAIDSQRADAHVNLGNALRGLNERAAATECYRGALALQPDLADAHYNLGIVLAEQHRIFDAEASYRRAVVLNPGYVDAHKNLGNTLKEQGRFDEAIECYRHALTLDPHCLSAQSSLVFDLNYSATHAIADCLSEARRFGAMTAAQTTQKFSTWVAERSPKRLRVGLVSGDLHTHPVGFFLEAVLAHLDYSRIELIAYHAHYEHDAVTARLQPRFGAWRPVHQLNAAQAAKTIHDDGVHVLIDLSGHTARNRLDVFAHRPAPVQATWLGYFATTGLAEMDYILGDPHVTPSSEEHHFVERVWRLPESYLCFTAPEFDLAPSPLPAIENRSITFGCFNNLAKLTDQVIAVWAGILRAVPNARLLLKTQKLDDSLARERLEKQFIANGIDVSRLCLEGASPRDQLLAAYRHVDIALDPFPYPGGTTSVEALWMGVPVVTRAGDRFISHVGETIAHNAGLRDWTAADNDDYVKKAVAFAGDLKKLAALREQLRAQVLASPLFDAPRFARNFAAALWGMWNETGAVR